jgi:hypothetical protein
VAGKGNEPEPAKFAVLKNMSVGKLLEAADVID